MAERILLGLVLLVSLWIRSAFPPYAIGDAGADDLLFVRIAHSLAERNWLGPYDNLTLAKGAAYPGFMAIVHALGAPLKLAEQLVYLLCALFFSASLAALFRVRGAALLVFTFLAFNPLFWRSDVGGRFVREGLYVSLSILLLALCIRAFVARPPDGLVADLRAKRWTLAALGIVAGIYWLTREEGVWLAPSALVLAGWWIACHARELRNRPGEAAQALGVFVVIPLVGFAIVVGAVNVRNLKKYGVFGNNDFRSADYQAAYGALSRIRHDAPRRYVVFPKDARERAYAASPAVAELRPWFEGYVGEFWRRAGCNQFPQPECTEVLGGWFMWALRDAVAFAGYYRDAVVARDYYERVAREVNAACDSGRIPCGPRRDSLVPVWREGDLEAALDAGWRVGLRLTRLGGGHVFNLASTGTDEQRARFREMANARLSAERDTASTHPRVRVARTLAAVQSAVGAIAIPLAIGVWIVLLALAVRRRDVHPAHAVVAALLAALGARVALLGFLEATSIPSDNDLYLMPASPMALALVPCVALLLFEAWRQRRAANTNARDVA